MNAEYLVIVLAGLSTEYYAYFTWFLIMVKSAMALSKLMLVIKDLYFRILRLTSGSPVSRGNGGVTPSAPKKIGKPRGFSTSAANQSSFGSFKELKESKSYGRLLDTVKPVGAMLSVKGGRPLVNHLLRVVKLAGMEVNLGLVKVIISFCNFCFKYIQVSGLTGLIIYLKACHVLLQQASGRHRIKNMSPLGIRFARSKGGLPKVIPALHRRRILRGEFLILKFWDTLFSVYRVLEMPYKLKLATITDPSSMDSQYLPEFGAFLEQSFWVAVSRLRGFDDTRFGLTWLEPWDFLRGLRAKPYIISKSSSAAGLIKVGDDDLDRASLSTSPAGILAAVAAWYENPHMLTILRDWCGLTGNQWVLNRLEKWNKILLPMSDPEAINDDRVQLYKGMRTVLGPVYARSLGKLGFKEEAAGKLRVFAYVDPFTQWLLKPLHDAIFEVLALIPQDGTLDQLAPVRQLIRAKPHGPYFSFDLSAATDRLPIVIQMQILAKVMTAHGANLWAALLIGRSYEYSTKVGGKRYSGSVTYAAGQPMGALSSWAMLALTHHAIVQHAALNARVIKPGDWFPYYAVLGDDIVLADAAVAAEYRRIMATLGVEVGLAKSLISPDGLTLEFAKRTFHRGVDVSPVPFSEYWVGRQMLAASLELCRKYTLSLPRYLDLFGFGYRAKGSSQGNLMHLGQRLRHRILSYFSPFGPNPMTLSKFFSLRGLTKNYSWTERKISAFISGFVQQELQRVFDKLLSPEMEAIVAFVKTLSTVNKDREYYGTLSREAPGARKIDLQDLYPDRPTAPWSATDPEVRYIDKDLYYHVVDDICQTVYREVYLDVLVELRELKYLVEDAIKAKSGGTLEDLERVVLSYYSFQESLSLIPLPKEIYQRVEAKTTLRNLEIIKQWEKYSRYLRSTVSTNPKAHKT